MTMFKIRRASNCLDETQPCERAEQLPVNHPAFEVPQAWGEGVHQIAARTTLEWFIRIDTLEELIELVREVKSDLIFDEDSIVIHDDYME